MGILHYRNNDTVVVISLHKMGDTIFTIPAVKRLFNYYKNKLVLYTFSENLPLYKLVLPEIKSVTVNYNEFLFSGRLAGRKHRKKLRALMPFKIIDLTGSIRGASLLFNSRAPEITGINENLYRHIYDNYVPVSYKGHLSEIYNNVADALKIPELPSNETEVKSENLQQSKGNNSLLIFPSAGWKAKEWGVNNFLSLAKSASGKYISFIVPQKSIREDIIAEIRDLGYQVIETNSTEEMISEIKNFSQIVCNDSGPSHVSELLNKRTITLFGPTNPDVHKQSSENSVIIFKRIRCSPVKEKMCFANGGRDCPSNECMLHLNSDEVFSGL